MIILKYQIIQYFRFLYLVNHSPWYAFVEFEIDTKELFHCVLFKSNDHKTWELQLLRQEKCAN